MNSNVIYHITRHIISRRLLVLLHVVVKRLFQLENWFETVQGVCLGLYFFKLVFFWQLCIPRQWPQTLRCSKQWGGVMSERKKQSKAWNPTMHQLYSFPTKQHVCYWTLISCYSNFTDLIIWKIPDAVQILCNFFHRQVNKKFTAQSLNLSWKLCIPF